MASFSIRNFGCRVNQAEAFDWAEELQRRGLRLEPDAARGDVVIVNSCTLTGRADRDVRKLVRKVLRENPAARVVVTGCLAERDPGEFERWPGVWKVVANAEKAGLPDLIALDAERGPEAAADTAARPLRARAMLKVQDGCGCACRFCVIPSVRGKSASVPLDAVVERARVLAARGFGEIVLTGIHLCSYGRDLAPRRSLAELLTELDALPGRFRVRLSSLDPRLMPETLVDRLVASPRICPHFHLSLQHASAGVLRAMGRDSAPEDYRRLLAALYGRAPEAALGADVIVGFPGETEADFRELEDFLEEEPLAYFHVFAYSPRPGTAAEGDGAVPQGGVACAVGATNAMPQGGTACGGTATMAVPARIKAGRAARLRRLSGEKWAGYLAKFIGRELEGIVVRAGVREAEILTPNYIDVRASGERSVRGSTVRVRIDGVEGGAASGTIVFRV